MTKSIALLGSTGSIGTNTLRVIDQHPESFRISSLAAGDNSQRMIQQANRYQPKLISMATREAAERVKQSVPVGTRVVWGRAGLEEVAQDPNADTVVTAVVGSMGLSATLASVDEGKTVCIANKESLVAGGELVMGRAQSTGATILPVDSEHSAIFQCLNGEDPARVRRIILTASGGAFRDYDRSQLADVTMDQALAHPNWSMGQKITIDSATMMNKGLEVIEAHWLFNLAYDQIGVMLHDESIVHSMIEFVDNSVMAQMGTPDMCIPIQYALSYPDRFPSLSEGLDLTRVGTLHFKNPDFERYPCLRIAFAAGRIGGTMPAAINAANEVAVERFLSGDIPFLGIEQVVEHVMSVHQSDRVRDVEMLQEVEAWAREIAHSVEIRMLTQ